jgi:hypothetical protein
MQSPLAGARVFLAMAALLTACIMPGCSRERPTASAANATPQYGAIARVDFNRRAAELLLPLFWRDDANANGNLEANELAILTGYPNDDRNVWIDGSGAFTAAFGTAYQQFVKPDVPPTDATEQTRHRLVLEELAQGRPTLVETDLAKAPPAERNLVQHLMNVARSIERIYARQKGVFGMEASIPADDSASRMLFHRNQSPFCEAPKTENEAACSALSAKPPRIVGLYPAELQSDPKFCDVLAKAPNAAELMTHFTTVINGEKPGAYRSIPYTEAYRLDMESIAVELEAAAAGLGDDESALKAYLLAAAGGFRTNDWEPANAAWVAMNAQNSKWYVRIAPDEVYYEPCAWKAGFALQLARINPDSIEWQRKLDPMKRDMENTLAAMAKAPYRARDVNFKIPDFIEVVLNAGDQRNAHGATIGQSLPNWGAVAEKGGRTVAMTNLYTDADSRTQQAALMSSTFCKATNALATTTSRETLIGSLLHEAAHNLGPAHEYRVKGKEDDVIFGGTLASTLEELKAQTSSMYLTDWLASKGIFTDDEVHRIQLRNIAWGFGHISRGMYSADGTPRNYSQLAAMQLGAFMEAGAVTWRANEVAANGTDQGCVEINFATLPAAVQSFETTVLEIKASGDKARAERLKAKYVDAKDEFAQVKAAIAERWLRAPKASFVYSVGW